MASWLRLEPPSQKETPMIEFDNTRRRLVLAAGAGLVLTGANSRVVRAAEKHDEDSEKEAARSKT